MSDAAALYFTHFYFFQGAKVDDVDSNGKTPRVLAVGRRNRMLIKFLDNKDSGAASLWGLEVGVSFSFSLSSLSLSLSSLSLSSLSLSSHSPLSLTLSVLMVMVVVSFFRTIVFGPPSRNRYGLIFFLCGMFIWAYPFYFFKVKKVSTF